jgi:hypothetical protein
VPHCNQAEALENVLWVWMDAPRTNNYRPVATTPAALLMPGTQRLQNLVQFGAVRNKDCQALHQRALTTTTTCQGLASGASPSSSHCRNTPSQQGHARLYMPGCHQFSAASPSPSMSSSSILGAR